MQNKIVLVLVSALFAGAISLRAQSAAGGSPRFTLTATATAVSQYMFRGQRLGGPSFQPAVELASDHAVLGVWSNFPIKDAVPGTSDPEIDLYGSYIFDLNDVVSVVPGFTWYTYPDAPTDQGFYRSTIEPSLALNYTAPGLKLTPRIYYDFTLKGPTFEFTAFYALPLASLGSELDFTATWGSFLLKDASKGSEPQTKAWGDYWLVGVSAPFQVSSNGKVLVGLAYTEGRDAFLKQGSAGKSPNSLAVGRAVVTLSYSHTF